MVLEFAQLEPAERYKVMVESIVPRPVAWIVTKSGEGVINVAPFSYFSGISSRPPLLMVAIGRRKKGLEEPKDTYRNLLETGRGTIVIPDHSQWELVEKSGEVLPASVSEAEKFGIELEEVVEGFPPIVKNSPRAFFVTLYGRFEREEMATIPFFLKIEKFYTNGLPFAPLARLGKGFAPVPVPSEEKE